MSDVKRNRVSNEQVLAAILGLTEVIKGHMAQPAQPAQVPSEPVKPVKAEFAQSEALISAKAEQDGPEMKAVCAKFGLNRAATAGTIRKFYSWCGTKGAKPGEYKLHVLSSMQGHVSLRWFRGEVKNSLGVIATS